MGETEEKRALLKAIERARKEQAAMAQVFAKLATSAAPDRSMERQLKDCQAERDESLRSVGEALLVWIAAGGQLTDGEGPVVLAELPPEDEDTGETVFAPELTRDPPTITRRRRRVVVGHNTMPRDSDTLNTISDTVTRDFGEDGDAVEGIRAFMDAVGDAEPPATPLEFLDGIQRLARVSDRTDRWKRMPRRVQQIFLAYCTCKARVWQENLDLGSTRHEVVLEQVFRALTRYSARERPGFVHGLSRSHRAERNTWAEDTHYWWTELCLAANIDPDPSNADLQIDELARTLESTVSDPVLQAAVVHALDNGVPPNDSRLLELISGRRDALEDEPRLEEVCDALDDEFGEPEHTDELPEDWPWFHTTQDKAAVIAGGDARPEATEEVRAAFQFDSLTWHADPHDRRLRSLSKRIEGGVVEMVFFLNRHGSEKAQTELRGACKSAGIPFVRIDGEYGILPLKDAIESWMHGEQA